jgi:hypothetical protein
MRFVHSEYQSPATPRDRSPNRRGFQQFLEPEVLKKLRHQFVGDDIAGFMTHKVRAVSAGVYLDDWTSGSLSDNLPIVQQSVRGVRDEKRKGKGLTP